MSLAMGIFDKLTSRTIAALVALTATALLSGCGGAGAGAGGTTSGGASGAGQVADIILFADKASLPATDGSTASTVTAQVKDAQNNVVRNQTVSFSTADTGVALSPVGSSTLTDASGRLSVRVELGSGAGARRNRQVPVVATAGGVSRTMTLEISGTKATIAGPDTLSFNTKANYTITVVDGANVGVGDVPLSISFDRGTVTPASARTAANGQVTVEVHASQPGSAQGTLRVEGMDMAPQKSIQVLGNDTPFLFVTPADAAQVEVNQDQAVRVRFSRPDTVLSGRPVLITATRGLFGGQTSVTAITDANGEAIATIRSGSAGQSTLTAVITVDSPPATSERLTTSSRVAFVSRIPSKIALSPDPTSIAANAVGSSSSTSRLIATVRDASDNPVAGARVAFTAVDPSGGRIEPGVSITDVDGQATASFIAGPNSTGPNQVVVRASILDTPSIAEERRMTVSAVALFVELGTGNQAEVLDVTSYRMPWKAIVTDANRNPVVGARVTASLTAVSYYKGIWVWNGTAHVPVRATDPNANPVRCLSEDGTRSPDPRAPGTPEFTVAPNNLLDAGEDRNANGRLDPGSPAAVVLESANGVTDANGLASVSVVYPKSFGNWVDVVLRVTIATSGTESFVTREFTLPVVGADVTQQTVAPPNVGATVPDGDPDVPPVLWGALVGPYGYRPEQDAATYGGRRYCIRAD
jgi:hypothetical protein